MGPFLELSLSEVTKVGEMTCDHHLMAESYAGNILNISAVKSLDSINVIFSLKKEKTLNSILTDNPTLRRIDLCKAVCYLNELCVQSYLDSGHCTTLSRLE